MLFRSYSGCFPVTIRLLQQKSKQKQQAPQNTTYELKRNQPNDQTPTIARHPKPCTLLLRTQLLHQNQQTTTDNRSQPLQQKLRYNIGQELTLHHAIPPKKKPYPQPTITTELHYLK